jgi:hypothetical protein
VEKTRKSIIRGFLAAGLPTFAPFDFERYAKLPDGTQVTVAAPPSSVMNSHVGHGASAKTGHRQF